ncbi:SMP-30/gluconolactonase/LRE family protein [[Eubacterium] cellulosolvens]
MRFNIHQVEMIQTGLDHPECINFGPDGRLYAGGFHGQIYVMNPPEYTLEQLTDTRGFVGGVSVDGSHNIYACSSMLGVTADPTKARCRLLRITQYGETSVYCDRTSEGPIIYPNYSSFDSEGNLYLADSGDYWNPSGRLIRIKPNRVADSVIGGNWHFPNGLALSPKEDAIFMIETRAFDILRIPIDKDGTLSAPQFYVQFEGDVLDGLAFSKNGNLYVSSYYPNRIHIISPDRNIELLIEDKTGEMLNQPTNLAFEPDGTRLFFANLGGQHVGAIDVGEAGAPLRYPKL